MGQFGADEQELWAISFSPQPLCSLDWLVNLHFLLVLGQIDASTLITLHDLASVHL